MKQTSRPGAENGEQPRGAAWADVRANYRFLACLALVLTAVVPVPVEAQAPRRAERAARLVATGQALVAAGNRASAASYFRRAIQVDSRAADAFVALAQIYVDAGRTAAALETLRVGLRRRPDVARLHLLLARTLRERGEMEEAAQVLRQLVLRSPESVAALAQRANLAEERGAWSEALASYRAIVALAGEGRDVPDATVNDATEHVAALRLLTREIDPVCGDGPIREALCR